MAYIWNKKTILRFDVSCGFGLMAFIFVFVRAGPVGRFW